MRVIDVIEKYKFYAVIAIFLLFIILYVIKEKENLKNLEAGNCKLVQMKGKIIYSDPKNAKVRFGFNTYAYFDVKILNESLLEYASLHDGEIIKCELGVFKGFLGIGDNYILRRFIVYCADCSQEQFLKCGKINGDRPCDFANNKQGEKNKYE